VNANTSKDKPSEVPPPAGRPSGSGKVLFKKGVELPKGQGQFMIELIENPITASLDILAYNVANLDVKDILTLKEHKGRALLENFNYDMN
jgi:hypothetical protein